MRKAVIEWAPEGRLCVWRYAEPRRGWRGWQFAADPPGCRSIRNLLDRMQGGDPSHRTLKLEPATDAILRVPNYRQKAAESFTKLRVAYQPERNDLELSPDGGTLVLMVGGAGLRALSAAFAEVEVGGGDFGIAPSDNRKVEPWMFWWMLNRNYKNGKRM